jgi:hypothetical protein
LKISKSALRHLQLPRVPITIFSSALLRFGIFELLYDVLADFPASPAFEDTNFELGPYFRCPGYCSFEFDKFAQILALQTSNTILQSFLVAIVKATLVSLLAVIVTLAFLVKDGLFVLEHELGECLIDDGLVLVVLVEDELGEVLVVVEQVPEGEDNVMTGVVNCIFGSNQIFGLSVFPPALDELCELLLYGVA